MSLLEAAAEFLNPQTFEDDAGFSSDFRQTARRGLRFLGVFAFCVPLGTALADILGRPDDALYYASLWRIALLIVMGAGMLMMGKWLPPREVLSFLLPALVFLLSAVQVVANFWAALRVPSAYHYTPGLTAMVIFICAALLPLKPWQTLVSSLSVNVAVIGTEKVIRRSGWLVVEDLDTLHLVTMMTVTFIATVVSSALWSQRVRQYRSAREAMGSRSRALLAEHSASLGQISAAISHEINSPLGTLVSAAGSMALVGRKLAAAPEEARPRLLKLQDELKETIGCASQRIEEIVKRMQQFSNLEGPEETDVDVNTLMRTALEMASAVDKVMFDPEVLAPVRARPAELSFVLYTMARLAGEGENPRWLRTRMAGSNVVVRFTPLQIPAEQFELRFVSEHGRMSAGSMSLFTARQIVRRHGGELLGEPDLTLTLPAAGSAHRFDSGATRP